VNWQETVIGIVLSLLATEFTDISPWLARKLASWAAYRWTPDPEAAAGYAEEWAAIIEERPGRLFKLLTAVGFAGGAIGRAIPRLIQAAPQRIRAVLQGIRAIWFELSIKGRLLVLRAVWANIVVMTVTFGLAIIGLSFWKAMIIHVIVTCSALLVIYRSMRASSPPRSRHRTR
jgi:hypothetical protein